jgi:hypothetical protein
MKTIEERARDYQRSDEDDGTTATAFQNGAEWMRKELTRWRDPKEELPEYYKVVEVKWYGSGLIRISTAWLSVGDAGGYLWTIEGTSRLINVRNILGWREIHE